MLSAPGLVCQSPPLQRRPDIGEIVRPGTRAIRHQPHPLLRVGCCFNGRERASHDNPVRCAVAVLGLVCLTERIDTAKRNQPVIARQARQYGPESDMTI